MKTRTGKNKVYWFVGVPVLLVILCTWYFGIFKCTTRAQLFRVLSDSFFVIGGICVGVGIISFCAKEGAFDFFRRMFSGKRADDEKEASWLNILFVCGVVLSLIGIVFACL